MKIINSKNKSLEINLSMINWLLNEFEVKFTFGDGTTEFFWINILTAKQIQNIYDSIRRYIVTDNHVKDNTIFESDYIINLKHEDISSKDWYLVIKKHDDIYNIETKIKILSNIVLTKKELVKAAYDLESELINEITNFWKNKLNT